MKKTAISLITKHNLIQKHSTVLLGLSGGPDSVCLLFILANLQKELEFNLIAAHLDHEARESSKQDSLFCQDLCQKLDIPLFIQKISALDLPKTNGSKEDFWRKARRSFFEKIAKETNAKAIALAHHLQDQEETFLIRLIRGSSLTGLTCMKAKDGLYIRPLLETNKNEILEFLKLNKIDFVIDGSNESDKFLRNRIRKNVIKNLQECDHRFDKNFLRTLSKLQEAEIFVENICNQFSKTVIENKQLNIEALLQLPRLIQHKMVLNWLIENNVTFCLTEKFTSEIIRFFQANKSKVHSIHKKWAIIKNKNFASINIK